MRSRVWEMRKMALAARMKADEDGGGAVGALAAVGGDEDAGGGDELAEEAGGVFDDDHEGAGIFDLADGFLPVLAAVLLAEFADGEDEAAGLEDSSGAEGEVGPEGTVDRVGLDEPEDAFEDGDAAAEHEHGAGDDEGPEVELFAVAEGVLLVGGALAAVHAEEEQEVVDAVDAGVDGLGQHGGAAGGGEELDARDGEVGGDRADDGSFGVFGHGEVGCCCEWVEGKR